MARLHFSLNIYSPDNLQPEGVSVCVHVCMLEDYVHMCVTWKGQQLLLENFFFFKLLIYILFSSQFFFAIHGIEHCRSLKHPTP